MVHKHQATTLHYDFRLEIGGVMRASTIPKGPALDSQPKRLAMPTIDHTLDYRHLEGILEEGQYCAGPVMVWDEGTYTPERGRAKGVLEAVTKRTRAEVVVQQGLASGEQGANTSGLQIAGCPAPVDFQRRASGASGLKLWRKE